MLQLQGTGHKSVYCTKKKQAADNISRRNSVMCFNGQKKGQYSNEWPDKLKCKCNNRAGEFEKRQTNVLP